MSSIKEPSVTLPAARITATRRLHPPVTLIMTPCRPDAALSRRKCYRHHRTIASSAGPTSSACGDGMEPSPRATIRRGAGATPSGSRRSATPAAADADVETRGSAVGVKQRSFLPTRVSRRRGSGLRHDRVPRSARGVSAIVNERQVARPAGLSGLALGCALCRPTAKGAKWADEMQYFAAGLLMMSCTKATDGRDSLCKRWLALDARADLATEQRGTRQAPPDALSALQRCMPARQPILVATSRDGGPRPRTSSPAWVATPTPSSNLHCGAFFAGTQLCCTAASF